ncbi:MAG: alpha/beta fold hydrolase [Actinomycetota bacterium]
MKKGVKIGLGAAGAAVALVVAGRLAVRRLRSRPDSEAGEPLGLLPPDDLGPVLSFDGADLAVRAAGPADAPAIVFAHGFSLDMTTWYYQWQALSDRYRCVIYDQRAHGRSGLSPADGYTIEAMGRDLKVVLDAAVGDRPTVLVGHSMGGASLMAFAKEFPEEFGARVQGAVFVDTWATDLVLAALGPVGDRIERALRPSVRSYLGDRDRAERLGGFVRRYGADLAFLVAWLTNFGPEASPSHVDHVSRIAAEQRPEVWVHTLASLVDVDLKDALANVKVPALVIAGDRDRITPPSSAEAVLKALPDARGVLLTRTGHVSQMERHRVVNDLLEDYLTRVLPVTQELVG